MVPVMKYIVERRTGVLAQAVGRQTASSGESTRTVQNHMASRTAKTTFVRVRRTAGNGCFGEKQVGDDRHADGLSRKKKRKY